MSADKGGSLKDILNGRPGKTDPAVPEDEEEKELRQDVGPCGWVWAKGCKALDIERGGKEPVVSLQYVYLGVLSEFSPGKFWVLFVGLQSWKVTVEGRNLRPLYDRLNDHCLRRIRQADRDFGGEEGKPFVTKIEVTDVTPRERE
ncbi:MAG: hypothetical protein K8U57_27510 [Planctomycetes bacterium]|nr:hypothetical protein [Planctomycetota bacterium]